MKKLVIIPSFALLLSLGFLWTMAAFAQSTGFSDVYPQQINREAVEYLQENEVVQGYDDGTYRPENRINRAEFTKIIIEAKFTDDEIDHCISENTQTGWSYAFFPDVPKNEWFAKYVCMAKIHGIIDGYPDGTFKPANLINFAEASKIIAESQEVPTSTAGTNNEWFAGYVKGLENKKVIPTTVQFFDKEVSRGEMAEMIWRLKTENKEKVTATYTELTDPFPAISSCAALKEKFDQYESYNYYRDDVMMIDMAMSATGTAPQAADSKMAIAEESAPADDYSSTNIQVSGVDEADVVKNDGKYIYMVKEGEVRIIDAYPPANMEVVSEITFDDENFQAQEMYVDGDQLVVIGQVNRYYVYYDQPMTRMIMPPHPYMSDQTRVYVFNISDRSEPVQERVVVYDGQYSTSRRINDQLYLVLNANPNVWTMDEVNSGSDLIPLVKDGDKEAEPMVGCSDIHYFPGFHDPRYMMVSSIPLDDPEGAIERDVFLGSSENVYASRTHLYVASSRVDYDRYTDWDWSRDRTQTQIFRFALDDGAIEFKGKGEVPGRILNQFSMDAYKNNFRIATTVGESWNSTNPSTNNVYVLDQDMKTVGSLEELAPGEQIYSTRFLGDRLYMVTFKKVDPLFVIDLSSPTNPKVLGKLKIPGFSDYLHPYDETHIIGFGKDTEEAKTGDFAWYQGIKIALFDVSDVENPKQMFVEIVGDRGTDSELLYNHKALLFDKEKNLFAFPVRIQTKVDNPDYDYDYYETTFAGALVYSLNLTDGFEERGRITHYSEEDILKMGDSWPYDFNKQIQRIIYIGNYLYTISQGLVKASTLDTVKEVSAVTVN